MAVKDEARVRKIGHLKVAVGFLILAVIGPLMWLTLSLRVEHPSEGIYSLEFFILVITGFVLIAASNKIIDKVYANSCSAQKR